VVVILNAPYMDLVHSEIVRPEKKPKIRDDIAVLCEP
jgi:hypothetical protein